MHLNYFFFNTLSKDLNPLLKGARLIECYSQFKGELCLEFDRPFFIKVITSGNFPVVYFPETISRAKKNTADIFPELMGKAVSSVEVVPFDRSFLIQFDEHSLLFKMHGGRSNVILMRRGKDNKLFNKNLKGDESATVSSLSKNFPSFDVFKSEGGNLSKVLPVLGKNAIQSIETIDYQLASIDEKWELFKNVVSYLENTTDVYIHRPTTDPQLSLLKGEEDSLQFSSALEAINQFFFTKIKIDSFNITQKQLAQERIQKISKLTSYVQQLNIKLEKLKNAEDPRYVADVIMANNYQLKGMLNEVSLIGFQGETLTIQFNGKRAIPYAENLYRKSKNRKIEFEKMSENIRMKSDELLFLQAQLEEIQAATSISEFKTFKKEAAVPSKTPSKFHEFEIDGFKILVGKNAKNNDLLTFGNTFKEDLWLHVKDTPGSHVVIKYQSGRKYSKRVIEAAASIAGHYSKRNTEGLVPVIYTPKKFIRKRKGDPAGAVVVEKEEVILVPPRLA